MGQKAWIPVACVACVMLAACRVSTPGRAETDVAQWTKKHITVQGKDNRNPLPERPWVQRSPNGPVNGSHGGRQPCRGSSRRAPDPENRTAECVAAVPRG